MARSDHDRAEPLPETDRATVKIPGAQRGGFACIDVRNPESMALRKRSRVRSGGLEKVDLDERKEGNRGGDGIGAPQSRRRSLTRN